MTPRTITDLDVAVASATAIVCDWNGTIVDDVDRALRATNRVLSEFGMSSIDLASFRELFCLPLDEFARTIGIPRSERDRAIELWNRSLSEGETRLQPGVNALLETARQFEIPVGVVSAASEVVLRRDAAALEIESGIDFFIGSVTSKSTVLHDLGGILGTPLLYVGDTEYDIREAQLAGAIAVAFGGGYRPTAALLTADPRFVITDFTELAESLILGSAERRHTSLTSKGKVID